MASAYQRAELVGALKRACSDAELYWNAMPEEEFVAAIGNSWSPADHVRHLTKSVRAVTRGLGMPRLVLWLLFGRARHVSRSYGTLVAAYKARLRAGGQAGRFAPAPKVVTGDPAAWRREVLGAHRAAVLELVSRIGRWSRADVDRLQLPHPILGKLTVREMLMFTLYHNQHHLYVVARRRGEHASDDTPLN